MLADVRKIAGQQVELIYNDTADRFDVLPLLVATDGAVAAFGGIFAAFVKPGNWWSGRARNATGQAGSSKVAA